MYAAMIECRTGTHRLTHRGWEDEYHTVTLSQEKTEADALRVALEAKHASPKEIRQAYALPWDQRYRYG